jgi:hypothetical protein
MKQVAQIFYSQDRDLADRNRFNFSTDFCGLKGFNQYGDAAAFLIQHGFEYKSWFEANHRPIEIWERQVAQ